MPWARRSRGAVSMATKGCEGCRSAAETPLPLPQLLEINPARNHPGGLSRDNCWVSAGVEDSWRSKGFYSGKFEFFSNLQRLPRDFQGDFTHPVATPLKTPDKIPASDPGLCHGNLRNVGNEKADDEGFFSPAENISDKIRAH